MLESVHSFGLQNPPQRLSRTPRLILSIVAAVLALTLNLQEVAVAAPNPLQLDLTRLLKSIPEARVDSDSRKALRSALALLGADRLDEGSQQLNSLLKLEPSSSYLQFFNGFAYHLMARQGDAEKFSLAEQGYLLAVQFDASNWIAHYF